MSWSALSHSRFSTNSLFRKTFSGVVTGVIKPSGSKIFAMSPRIACFVGDISAAASNNLIKLNFNKSRSLSRTRPSTFGSSLSHMSHCFKDVFEKDWSSSIEFGILGLTSGCDFMEFIFFITC